MQQYIYNLLSDRSRGLIPVILRFFLFILSLVYGLIIRFLILFYRLKPTRLGAKVISVGNITLGGTGKTSLVGYIAKYSLEKGRKVAILTRGYKRENPKSQIPNFKIENMGDEAYMLSRKLDRTPVVVDADRIRGAKKAINLYSTDTLILDDGFQQWGVVKDLEIVTIDAANPFGNRQMIPRGILREPLSSLKRADIFVLTKTNLSPDTKSIKNLLNIINPRAQVFGSVHQAVCFYRFGHDEVSINRESFIGRSVALFSGIGDPGSFEELIKTIGIKVGLSVRFPDHHNYSQKDIQRVIASSREKNIDTIITTEKDAARLGRLAIDDPQAVIIVLKIELKFNKDEEFRNRLLKLFIL
ncbi:MAG: tetraacyldisaccharide 4'-kinase [Candidatus Omnitrophota bacterium]